MLRRFALVFLLVPAMILSLGPLRAPAALALSPAKSTEATVLYQANWKSGLGGWSTTGGFRAGGGILSYSGHVGEAIAPFQTRRAPNFAVEALIRIGSLSSGGAQGFGILVRYQTGQSASGIHAGIRYQKGNIILKGAMLNWKTVVPDFIGGTPFSPGSGWHRYRLEVLRNAYRLLVDGKQMMPFTVVSSYSSFTGLGIWSDFTRADVKEFKVLALGSVRPIAALDTRPLEARMLAPRGGTVSGFSPTLGRFRSNDEYARLNGISLATVRRQGRVLSYTRLFQSGDNLMYAALGQFTSSKGAVADKNLRARLDRQTLHGRQVSVVRIGDQSTALVADTGKLHEARIYFTRGAYSATVDVMISTAGRAQSTAVSIAKQLDQRLRAAH